MGRASKDKRDVYYRKAKEEGYRARSAYKLLQLHEEFGILRRDRILTGVVDLCAAPGSWSQVLSAHLQGGASDECGDKASQRPRIVAVDLQEMMPIKGVELLQGDITSEATAKEIIRLINGGDPCDSMAAEEKPSSGMKVDGSRRTTDDKLQFSSHAQHGATVKGTERGGDLCDEIGPVVEGQPLSERKADLVVCDGAPDVTGMHELDEYLQHHLLLAALNITTFVLRHGGTFVTKIFRGPNTPFLVAKAEVFFRHVAVAKPRSSRNASMEAFMVCQDYQPPASYRPSFKSPLTDFGSCFTPEAPLPPALNEERKSCLMSEETQVVSVEGEPSVNTVVVPFLACGDLSGYDADMCYDRSEGDLVLPPVHPPLQAPYIVAEPTAEYRGVQGESAKRRRVC
ncbi:putative FtsJ like methyltransferase [Trypanosoma vivax]|uniref:Putative tRNA (cytidine(32)/guanosine(34)-2'-O)-methyltransferase n=1 Tax=Trypanosoma vivax (strain Y486) TaxID=1055687 RepID=G0TRQ6_TRYVY|nr:putative ribosomal rRNA methyltransferase [Trypanosoma vivax]KAH8608056.1 putative FtsJ like methyltransferase [Trypanosoma vivax]CCC46628.1 putative ribosomal RNA methyltransferase [Trypanosoma vivax Y486]